MINDIINKLNSLRDLDVQQLMKKKDVLINVAIIIVALIAIRSIRQNQAQRVAVLNRQVEDAKSIGGLLEQANNTKKQIDIYKQKLPVDRDFTEVVKEVTALARQNSLEITNFTQQSIRNTGLSYDLPLSLAISGIYYDIWNFLRDIENSQKEFFTIESVSINESARSSRIEEQGQSEICSANIGLYATSIRK